MTQDPTGRALTLRSLLALAAAGGLLALAVGLGCSLVGVVRLPAPDAWLPWEWSLWRSSIWQARSCRLAAAALVGASLSTGGLALQGLLRNPLAEPYLLGLSSGAGVGVLAGSLLALPVPEWAATPCLALAGALASALVVFGVARRGGRLDPWLLLLTGVMVNVFNGALVLAVLQLVREADVVRFLGWGMGQIPEWLWFKPGLLWAAAAVVVLGWAALAARAAAFNVLGLGEEVAATSGVDVGRIRVETFAAVALMTAAAVSLAGPVGFVGLLVPHLARALLGPDHRRLMVACGFGGAAFLMAADTACRLAGEAFRLGELPVGVATALGGGVFFLCLLRRQVREGGW